MIKPEWGTKRTCPKCATRFYDLGQDDPVTCINCRSTWVPEPVLKSKQPLTFEAPTKAAPEAAKDEDLAGPDEDLALVEDEENPRATARAVLMDVIDVLAPTDGRDMWPNPR